MRAVLPEARAMRHEWKHQIHLGEDLVLSRRLRRLFPHDSHAGPDGSYRVTSLYFDTPYDQALREKLDGVDRREKFRLRYYGCDTGFLRLEKKYKVNGLCGKRSVSITAEEARLLLAGEDDFLLASGEPLRMELYSKIRGKGLRPRTIVRYDREAFCYGPGNVRLTLDRRVRTGLCSTAFLDPDRFCLPVLEGITVLEVKYDAFLPDLVRMAVQVPGRQAAACSKYALCRRYD
ncbi:polyphosphate polymerase domain-containing protein [Pseudoflavonifractor phocaeensis]|uniref:polyphosphate polymerase domain-containing protein n=1 Tax=Pseudoflavonifractor phocaeensis TaxID=1870988 RepID=UPI001FAF4235|nr:polyphosphate polymerase domain-containing protein [Pseudoflavonifractor phocaeensis]